MDILLELLKAAVKGIASAVTTFIFSRLYAEKDKKKSARNARHKHGRKSWK
ncbi:hypothetical protein [Bacillus sp. 1P06AnD]|uniref:hypothetical protein n=1 Tax=Bacillus sp. 1P06AnD TaxID=3132208 RepID=UPI0039A3C354